MRSLFSVIFVFLIIALGVCVVIALKSRKDIGRSVAFMLLSIIPPVIGNLMIVCSGSERVSTAGRYIYFVGMDLVMYALLRFTRKYCGIKQNNKLLKRLVNGILLIDAAQILSNIVFGHTFGTDEIMIDGFPYYRVIPYIGQTFHRAVDYGIFAVVIIVFIIKTARSPRIYAERYYVILLTMIVSGLWQSYYIFSRTPIDRSMIGFAVFGLMVFYFSIYYRPMRLLDRMLACIVSEMPEALFFYDESGRCIWANGQGIALAELRNSDYEQAPDRLRTLFGESGTAGREWINKVSTGEGDAEKCYILQKRQVNDVNGRNVGYYLSIRDNTSEQRTLEREKYRATHDGLTGLYDRSGYDMLIESLPLPTTFFLLMDLDRFKEVNDTYGHETGDAVLRKLAGILEHNFRAEDYICRIGGDEFVVLMLHTDEKQKEQIGTKLDRIDEELSDTADGLPPVSVSVGVAHGSESTDARKLFEQADAALYETKRRGRRGYTFYTEDLARKADQE